MKRILIVFLLFSILISGTSIQTYASSAGDEDSPPPPAGSSGGASASPNFFDYFVPLIFGPDHPNGISEISVWVPTPAVIITSFQQNDFGSTVSQLREPTKLTFNPEDNLGLTNGSLIRVTTPSLVVGQRYTADIQSDNSFSYSILPRRMMGFEYYAPFDGHISLISLNPGTEIQVSDPDGAYRSGTIDLPGTTITLNVKQGSYINSSFPTNGAFYSDIEGKSASMAVPRYFHGAEYAFDTDLVSPRPDEIDRSYISINPSEPTELEITFRDGTKTNTSIFGPIKLDLDTEISGFKAYRGKLEANVRIKYDYAGQTRISTVQLISLPEMRAGEIFITPSGYSSHFTVAQFNTNLSIVDYNSQEQSYVNSTRHTFNTTSFETWDINSLSNHQIILADDYLFGISISPGEDGHPMSPSLAFLNIPINTVTSKNITGIASTWYRFANLAVTEVDIIPGPAEEYTGQTIFIEITANGSLPSSAFNVEITIDDEVEIEDRFDFLQVNESITYRIRKFLPFGKKALNITVDVDTDNEVSEINEDDNTAIIGFNVNTNIRLRWSLVGIIVLSVVYLGYITRKWLRRRRQIKRAHVDAILSIEEEE